MTSTGSTEPTRRQREQLAAADHDVDDARRDHATRGAPARHGGMRGRRHARRDLAAADNRLTWANHTLDQLRPAIAHRRRPLPPRPAAGSRAHVTRCAATTRGTLDRYTTIDRIPQLHRGSTPSTPGGGSPQATRSTSTRLGEIVDILGSVDGDHGRYRWLADTVEQYCHDAGIHLPTVEPELPASNHPASTSAYERPVTGRRSSWCRGLVSSPPVVGDRAPRPAEAQAGQCFAAHASMSARSHNRHRPAPMSTTGAGKSS